MNTSLKRNLTQRNCLGARFLKKLDIDNKISFNEHVKSIFKKKNNELMGLSKSSPLVHLGKRKILLNAFVQSLQKSHLE